MLLIHKGKVNQGSQNEICDIKSQCFKKSFHVNSKLKNTFNNRKTQRTQWS